MSEDILLNNWVKKALLLFFLMAIAGNAMAAERTKSLIVLGSALIHDQDMAAARDQAILDARVAAVGSTVAEMLTEKSVTKRFQMINENILSQPDPYVSRDEVLSEAVTDQSLRVLMKVDLAVAPLRQDLAGLGLGLAGTVAPRILFMLSETNVGDSAPTVWWGKQLRGSPTVSEGAMAAILHSAGCKIVGGHDLSAPLGMADAPSDPDMLALARRLGADVVIAGSATAALPYGAVKNVVAAEVVVRALDVHSGNSLGHSRQHAETASGLDVRQAGRKVLASAGSAAADDLERQILAGWQQGQGARSLITLVIDGINGQIVGLVRLRTAIAALPEVKDLRLKEMTGDQSVLVVNYDGTPRALADALSQIRSTDFGIDLESVADDTVRLLLRQP